ETGLLLGRLCDRSIDTPPGASVQDALAALSQSSKVRSVLAAMVRLTSLVHAPRTADGLALLDQLHGGLTRNVLYLDGGWAAMIEALTSACIKQWTFLRSSSRAASIEQGPAWRVTLADGSAVMARAIVLAVGPAQAAALYPAIADVPNAT